MVLTQADVAELSAWHQDRKGSLVKLFGERVAERKVITGERNILKELDKIKGDILKGHNLKDARKQIGKMLGPKGDLKKFLTNFEEVTNFNFKMLAAVAFAVGALAKITKMAEIKHLEPHKMAEDTMRNLRDQGGDIEKDMQSIRLMAQKIEALEKKAA